MNLSKLEKQLALEEGRPPRTYLDTKNILTGGIGHNLIAKPERGYDRVGIQVSDEMCTKWFESDIQTSMAELDVHLPWWKEQDDVRQNALLDLCFNMGISGLKTFIYTLEAFSEGKYTAAAKGFRNSQWARDVKEARTKRITDMIQTGEWPTDV